MVAILAIKECTIEEIEELMKENPDSVFYRVCCTQIFLEGVKNALELIPNIQLYRDYHQEKITSEEYIPRYLQQIQGDPAAMEKLQEIKKEAESKDVYLVCVCSREKQCHRFLLIEIISSENKGSSEQEKSTQ